MEQARLQELLEKLANNRITATELDILMQAIQDEAHYDKLDQVLGQFQHIPNDRYVDNRERSIRTYQQIISDQRFVKSRRQKRIYLTVAAASIVMTAISLIIVLFYTSSLKKKDSKREFTTTWTAPLGKQRQIVLSDGTSVWLNAGSKLGIATDFNQTDRRVSLVGEAYFNVRTDQQKPFSVITGSLTTSVLGTIFNINSFDAKKVTITVAQGKIAVQRKAETLSLLTENQQLLYNVHTGIKKLKEVKAVDFTAWIHQRLRFNNVSMAEAGKSLERWSNKTFVYRNPAIRACHFTVSFHKGEDLKQMLNVICALNDFKYEIKSDTVYLDGKGCQ